MFHLVPVNQHQLLALPKYLNLCNLCNLWIFNLENYRLKPGGIAVVVMGRPYMLELRGFGAYAPFGGQD